MYIEFQLELAYNHYFSKICIMGMNLSFDSAIRIKP